MGKLIVRNPSYGTRPTTFGDLKATELFRFHPDSNIISFDLYARCTDDLARDYVGMAMDMDTGELVRIKPEVRVIRVNGYLQETE